MIIEPVPATTRSHRRRVARLAGTVAPVALLAVIVGAGVLGGSETPRTATDLPGASAPRPGSTDDAPGSTGDALSPASPRGTSPAVPAGRSVEDDGSTRFPTVAAGLRGHTVVEALALRDIDPLGRLLAVAGYLGVLDPPAGCQGGLLGPFGPACERVGVLAQAPWSFSGAAVFAGLGPHLHPRFPVGISLPAGIARTTAAARGDPIPVVVIGSFEAAPDDCGQGANPCDARFLADGIAWADGATFDAVPMLDAGLDSLPTGWVLRNERVAEVAAIGWAGTILAVSLVRPATVPSLDPAAGAALAAVAPPAGLVWYVRGLETGYDAVGYPFGHAAPRLTWVVVDDVTGAVLARSANSQPAS